MAKRRKIYVSDYDMKRLEKLIELLSEDEWDDRDTKHLQVLEEELRKAEVVAARNIPRDTVTMNSKVRVKDLDTGIETIYHLVFPGEADVKQNRISVLAPIGTALIGYAVGDVIQWHVPAGTKKLRIEEILYQPEAAGDFHL